MHRKCKYEWNKVGEHIAILHGSFAKSKKEKMILYSTKRWQHRYF